MKIPTVHGFTPLVALLALSVAPLHAQSPDAGAAVDAAMAPLAWLVGEWEGAGTMHTSAGPQRSHVVERVESRLDGRVLVIEGVGRRTGPDGAPGEVVHHAIGVLSYDPDRGRYVLHAFRDGRVVDAETALEDGVFTWGFGVPGGTIRHHIRREAGDWLEQGEFSRDGATWSPFFEMRLQRVDGGR